jgi:hypothetical protein
MSVPVIQAIDGWDLRSVSPAGSGRHVQAAVSRTRDRRPAGRAFSESVGLRVFRALRMQRACRVLSDRVGQPMTLIRVLVPTSPPSPRSIGCPVLTQRGPLVRYFRQAPRATSGSMMATMTDYTHTIDRWDEAAGGDRADCRRK